MKVLKYAALVTLAGLALGWLAVGVEWLMEWAMGDLVPDWVKLALGLLLFGGLVIALVWAGISVLVRDPQPSEAEARLDALRCAAEALAGVERVGDTLSSEDGRFLFALIQMPTEQWSSAFELYSAEVASLPADAPDVNSLYFLFLTYEKNRVTVLPIPFHSATISCTVTLACEYVGFRRKLLKALHWAHKSLEEAHEAGWIRTCLTTVAVFWIAAIHKSAEIRWSRFLDQTLPRYLESDLQGTIALPAGIALRRVRIRFEVPGRGPLPPLVIDLDPYLPQALVGVRGCLGLFGPFNARPAAVLELPFEPD